MIPHVAPPLWAAPIRSGRFASTILQNAPELFEHRESREVLEKCRVGLIGIPDDTGVELNHGRVGAAQGPQAFRQALSRYGAASSMALETGAHGLPRVFDAGDVIPGQDLHETHDRVTEAVVAMLELGLFPVAIGGGHDLTFAFVRGVARVYGVMAGVYLDAHLDVRAEMGSGMSFRSLVEAGLASNLYVLGVDPLVNTREHAEYFRSVGGSTRGFEPDHWPSHARQFVSLDMDVLDMSHAPGVSAMNPCGWSPARVGEYVEAAGKNSSVKCFDIMELSPVHDESGRTSRLAAHLFMRFLVGLAQRSWEV